MNDTFDQFNFSSIQADFSSLTTTHVCDNATRSTNISTPNVSSHKGEISFDDSQFLSSIETPTSANKENIDCNKLSPIQLDFTSENGNKAREESPPPFDIDNSCDLSSWKLPEAILEKYSSRNITSMFPWQVECLKKTGVLDAHRNLVYSAPTSAGKTLVAEILAIKTVLERQLKVIIILPFVSVVREKMFYLQDILGSSGVRVEGFMGSYNPPGGFESVQIAICTIEKANSLINRLLVDDGMREIGCVVVDEMHLLGDPSRGYLLELLLTKLTYITRQNADVNIQIVGMSATLPNLTDLAQWLQAELYVTSFRPVPLYEQAHVCGEMYDSQLKLVRTLNSHPDLLSDTDNILQLCLETISRSCSVLIFCPTKNWCENLAQQIAQAFWQLGASGKSELSDSLRAQIKTELITELLEQLKYCPVGLDDVLRKTVSFGVAFHHAGLTMDERDIVEGAFRNGAVRVLVATSTLSSGVNLPAQRVIIRTPNFHGKSVDILTYRQMIGRAGRMGKDTSGESILVCQKNDYNIAKTLMTSQLPPIESCLSGGGKLKRAILEVVASSVVSNLKDVDLFTNCTLLARTERTDRPIREALDFLTVNEFIRLQTTENGTVKYIATSLGKACLTSSIPPDEGLALFSELERARRCIVLESELHLIYLITPYSACHQWASIDWMLYLRLWGKLSTADRRVGELVGIDEAYIVHGNRSNKTKLFIHERFYVALALQDLVNEKPLNAIAHKFGCNRGLLQSLQLTAATFAGMVTAFSKQLGWCSIELLISQFQHRLQFGVARELLDLMRLPLLNCKSARALYDSGFETMIQLANTSVDAVEDVLHRVVPFQSGKAHVGEHAHDLKERNKSRNIWITGKQGLTEREAAELIVTSARNYLQVEMGLKEAKWHQTVKLNDDGFGSMDDDKVKVTDLSAFDALNLSNTPVKFTSNTRSDESLFDTDSSEDDAFISTYCQTQNQGAKRHHNSSVIETPTKKKKLQFDLTQIEIIDVTTSNRALYDTFVQELRQVSTISLALGCSKVTERRNLVKSCKQTKCDGFAITWGGNTVYYLSRDFDILADLTSRRDLTIKLFDAHQQLKILNDFCKIDGCQIEDCKIADWIVQPEGKEKNLQAMTVTYFPEGAKLSQICGTSKGVDSISLDIDSSVDSRLRACTESLLAWYLVDAAKDVLYEQNPRLLDVYGTEMACLRLLCGMECHGIGVDKKKLRNLVSSLGNNILEIEKIAYGLAGRRFSFTSPKEVSKVVGLSFRGRRVSTKKAILEECKHPIARLVLQWRKIHHILTKTIQPLVLAVDCGDRIYGSCILNTVTGRVAMQEPNLQNVAKNFDWDDDATCGVKLTTVNCRNCFIPTNGRVMLSADYCQLELRLLAHLSQDPKLCSIMRRDGDVFRSLAAQWNGIREYEVTDSMRQNCKQLCYAMIYGMGTKGLASQLKIEENQAGELMQTFKMSFPGIQIYINKVVDFCRKSGYVETICGRRRYLPYINDSKTHLQKQAERQAVNTTIQGSAADLVKKSMIDLDEEFSLYCGKGEEMLLLLQLHDELIYEVNDDKVKECASILKRTMENSPNLSIPLPVKVKCGKSWGELDDYDDFLSD